jgi:ketosteroid isomerase-like protein
MSSREPNSRPRENVELISGAFQSFTDRGPDSALEMMDPEVEVVSEQHPNAGTFHGIPGYKRWSDRWFDAWEGFVVEVEMIEPVGERHVVVTGTQRARGAKSGIPVEMKASYMIEIGPGGLATRFHLYPNRDDALAEARRGEAEEQRDG